MHTWDLVKSLSGILCTLRADVAFRSPSTPVYRSTSHVADTGTRCLNIPASCITTDRSARTCLRSVDCVVVWWNTIVYRDVVRVETYYPVTVYYQCTCARVYFYRSPSGKLENFDKDADEILSKFWKFNLNIYLKTLRTYLRKDRKETKSWSF